MLMKSSSSDLYKRICVAGNDPEVVEAASEPKWSFKGNFLIVTLDV